MEIYLENLNRYFVFRCKGESQQRRRVATTTSTVLLKHELFVDMTCEGCSSAVSRVLNKLGGVECGLDLPKEKVCVNSEHSVDLLLETLGKTGQAVSYLGPK
ncbi:copper transport protein ATOX1-like [Panthera leo]|uniref:copper transport protein ATOX1-like n=1 Tax=Panthera leo TaxID=9689 RepID=UPI001C6A2AB4|nr:copper transport protein ATOX1-like [Panthera leo]